MIVKNIFKQYVILSVFGLFFSGHALASNWDLSVTPNKLAPGKNVYIAYTYTSLNSEFSVICDHRGLAVELIIEGVIDNQFTTMDVSFGVDGKSLINMRGYLETIDDGANTAIVFIGPNNRPNVSTPKIIQQLKRGNELFIVDPKNDEIIEEISLRGSSKAITSVQKACETGVAGSPEDEVLDDVPLDEEREPDAKI